MPWLPLALGAISAGSSLLSQDKANSANKRRYRQGLGDIEFGRRKIGQFFDEGEFELRSGMGKAAGEIERGFGSALNEATGVGVTAATTIEKRRRQGVAEADKVLSQRGLYDSTAALGVRRQAAYDANLATGQLGESIAGIRSGLMAQKGLAMGDVRARTASLLGSHFINRAQSEMDLLKTRLDWIYGRTDTAGGNWLGLLAQGTKAGGEIVGSFKKTPTASGEG